MSASPGLASELLHCGLNSPAGINNLLSTFSKMLARGLSHKSNPQFKLISKTWDQELKSLTDHTTARTNHNTARIQDLQDQLESALYKVDDLENRSRRYSFRIRGLPESVKDIREVVRSFIKDLIPDIPTHHLELDRAHRSLQPPRLDGLPRDIVVKPHYYAVKEEVMKRSRNSAK